MICSDHEAVEIYPTATTKAARRGSIETYW